MRRREASSVTATLGLRSLPFSFVQSTQTSQAAVLVVAVLAALCGSVLGGIAEEAQSSWDPQRLGGSVETLPQAARLAELAVEKGASTILMPVAARRQLNELPDDIWTKVNIEFYRDPADAIFKALDVGTNFNPSRGVRQWNSMRPAG